MNHEHHTVLATCDTAAGVFTLLHDDRTRAYEVRAHDRPSLSAVRILIRTRDLVEAMRVLHASLFHSCIGYRHAKEAPITIR